MSKTGGGWGTAPYPIARFPKLQFSTPVPARPSGTLVPIPRPRARSLTEERRIPIEKLRVARIKGDLEPVLPVELLENATERVLYGLLLNAERAADLLVGAPRQERLDDLDLAAGESFVHLSVS